MEVSPDGATITIELDSDESIEIDQENEANLSQESAVSDDFTFDTQNDQYMIYPENDSIEASEASESDANLSQNSSVLDFGNVYASNLDADDSDIETSSEKDDSDISSDNENHFEEDEESDDDGFIPNVNIGNVADYVPKWTDKFEPIDVPYCTAEQGPKLPSSFDTATAKPIDYFSLFWPDSLFQSILDLTNVNVLYKREIFRKKKNNPDWTDKLWKEDVSMDELKAFFALNICFGICPNPTYHQYWSMSPYLGNEGVKKVMPLKRYEKISQYLHVADRALEEIPVGQPGYDKLAKVRPILDHISTTFPKYFHPGHKMSIDEGLVKFKGRLSYVQFMPMKPVKRGIKLFMRCDSDSGYLYQMEVYLGKLSDGSVHKNAYFYVVDRLTSSLRGKNYQIFFDNLYTSVPLLLHLMNHKIYSCGTLRANRVQIPPEIKNTAKTKMLRGKSLTRQDAKTRNLTTTIWQDTKLVRFASTLSSPDGICNARRRINGRRTDVSQPICAYQYSESYCGVDKSDQYRSYYKVGRTSKRYWKYLLFFALDVTLVNAHIVYKEVLGLPPKKYSSIQFRLDIVNGLINGFSSRQRKNEPKPLYVGPLAHRNLDYHRNEHMGKTRRCIGHKRFKPNGKILKQTVYGCKVCNVHLCQDCHHPFHSNPL